MRAVLVSEHGDTNVLRFVDVPVPTPGPGEVRVRIRACGVNHLDIWLRKGVPGHRFPLPLIPGNDAAGEVDAVGEEIDDLEPGARVVIAPGTSCGHCQPCSDGRDHHCLSYAILGEHRDGGNCDFIVVPRANVLALPEQIPFEVGAALGVAFLTSWHMLSKRARVRPGETVLILGATSGVGTAAIQIAKILGATVIAASSTPEKRHALEDLSVDAIVDSTSPTLSKDVKALTDGRGADVVVEHVGSALWEQATRCLAWQGRLVTCGATSGAEAALNLRHVFFKSLSILGSTMGSRGDFHGVLSLLVQGKLNPTIHKVFPLSEVGAAHRLLEERSVVGKLVLTP